MRPFATLFVLLSLIGPAAAAQPAALVVTPDTLRWGETWPPPAFDVVNAGPDSLRLDTLAIGPCPWEWCQWSGPGYAVRLDHGGASHYGFLWPVAEDEFSMWFDTGRFPDVVLAPADTATFTVESIDPCPICRGGGVPVRVPVWFWAGGDPTPVERTLAYDLTVGAEPGAPPAGPSLAVAGPNPASGATALVLTLGAPADVEVTLFDALGRQVRVLHDGPLPAGAHRLAVEAGGLGPGLYFARAVAGAGRGATGAARRLVLLR